MDPEIATKFFVEQEERMKLPDESTEEFVARTADRSKSTPDQWDSFEYVGRRDSNYCPKTPRDASNSSARHSVCSGRVVAESPPSAEAGRALPVQDVSTSGTGVSTNRGKRKPPDHTTEESGPPEKRRRHWESISLTNSPRNISPFADDSAQDSVRVRPITEKGLKAGKSSGHKDSAGNGGAGRSSKPVNRSIPPPSDVSPASKQLSGPDGVSRKLAPVTAMPAPRQHPDASPKQRPTVTGQIRAYHQSAPQFRAATRDQSSAPSSVPLESPPPEDQTSRSSQEYPERGKIGQTKQSGKDHARNGTSVHNVEAADLDSSNVTTPGNTPANATKQPAPPPPPEYSFIRGRKMTAIIRKELEQREKVATAEAAKPKKKPLKQVKAMSPAEYAVYISSVEEPYAQKKGQNATYLAGMKIYWAGVDTDKVDDKTMTKLPRLVHLGATLVPTYDPSEIEIILAHSHLTQEQFCTKHGLQSLKDVPAHIPILDVDWMNSPEKNRFGRLDKWEKHAKYKDHVVRQPDPAEKGKARLLAKKVSEKKAQAKNEAKVQNQKVIQSDESDFDVDSSISQFTQDLPNKGKTTASAETRPGPHSIQGHLSGSSGSSNSGKHAGRRKGQTSSSLEGGSSRAPGSPTEGNTDDPLAEFYEQARAEQEAELETEKGGYLQSGSATTVGGQHSQYQCDNVPSGAKAGQCANQDVVDILTQLAKIHEVRQQENDQFRVMSYRRALSRLRSYPTRIQTWEEAEKIPNVGARTADKIMEIITTGRLRRLDWEMSHTDLPVLSLFQGIYGCGPNTALRWYAAGCRTLDDIRKEKGGIKLTEAQELGLKYYDDINTRIPREEVGDIFQAIKDIARDIDPKLIVEVMGSYRRGKADCGDIDILVTRPTDDKKSHSGMVQRIVNKCQEYGIIVDHLSIPRNWWNLELVYHGLCRRDENSPVRRLDFLAVPYENRGAALLYFTGDDIFNRSMRMKANHMGYSLNQRGLYDMVVRNPGKRSEKINAGVIIASETEEEIFEKLGVPWQEPHQRVR